MLAATAASIGAASAPKRRRALAAATASSADLRAGLLANLALTYAITRTTQADLSSLLAVLAGLTDTTNELYRATATGALSMLFSVRVSPCVAIFLIVSSSCV